MAKESKVQKVARQATGVARISRGTCQCGGGLIWTRVSPHIGKARMRDVCEKCGAIQ